MPPEYGVALPVALHPSVLPLAGVVGGGVPLRRPPVGFSDPDSSGFRFFPGGVRVSAQPADISVLGGNGADNGYYATLL